MRTGRSRTSRPPTRPPFRPFILTEVGIAHFLAHRLDEAAAKLLKTMQLAPSYVTPYYYLAACYAHLGRRNDAREVFRRLTVLTPPAAEPLVIMPQPPSSVPSSLPATGWRWRRRPLCDGVEHDHGDLALGLALVIGVGRP